MAIQNGYCTLTEIKARLDITDTADDTILENIVEAASRHIDGYCNRRFYAASETRYFTPDAIDWLFVDDLLTVTTFKTDEDADRVYETTWATTDYDLEPVNATYTGEPYTMVTLPPTTRYAFPSHARAVQIVGSFGYASTTPDAINEACLLIAARLFKRKDAPFGVTGTAELGQLQVLPGEDQDAKRLLAPYRRFAIGAV